MESIPLWNSHRATGMIPLIATLDAEHRKASPAEN